MKSESDIENSSLTLQQQLQNDQHDNQATKNTNLYTVAFSSDSCSSSSSSWSSASSSSSGYNSSNSCNSFTTTKPISNPSANMMITSGADGTNKNGYYQQQPQQQYQQQQFHHPQQQQYYTQKTKEIQNHLINRSLDFVNTAAEDPTFLTDSCLENALKAEEKRPQPICTYFKKVQTDITPPMRKVVAEWMMEVCAEEKCQDEVVLLALNYMDRFLSTKSVRKTHLQILAAACLLLASKLREPSCRALSADLLVFYTDNSIYKSDLIKWELYVLSRLGWDLSSVTPLDFLELLLIRLPIRSTKCPDVTIDKVRQHAHAFISLAAKEHYFSIYSASTIAASSIAAAMNGLNWHLHTGNNLRYLFNLLTDLTSVQQDYIQECMQRMENVFEEQSRKLQPYLITAEHASQHHAHQQQQQHFTQTVPPTH